MVFGELGWGAGIDNRIEGVDCRYWGKFVSSGAHQRSS
jgi:hypothetical protein